MSLSVKKFWQLSFFIFFVVVISTVLLNLTYQDIEQDFARKEAFAEARSMQRFVSLFWQIDSGMTEQRKLYAVFSLLGNKSNQSVFRAVAWYNVRTDSLWLNASESQFGKIDSLLKTNHAPSNRIRLIPLQNQKAWILMVPINAGHFNLVLKKEILRTHWFSHTFWILFAPFILTVALLLILILFVVYHSFKKPLKSVHNLAEHLNAGDYDYRIQYSKNDEFTDTFIRINRSLERMGVGDESYHEKEENIRNLLEVLDESIVVLNSDLKLVNFNPAVAKLFNCKNLEDFPELFHRILEENMTLRDLFRQLKTLNQEVISRALILWVADERELNVNVTIQKLDDRQMLLMFKDLSRIRDLQTNLQRSMKFGIIANLVSSISHEIRNPLSAVGIHAEILSNRLAKQYPDLDEKLKKSLAIIQNEIKRINRIHTQFFNLARKRELKLTTLKPNSLIEDVIQLVQHHALEQQITLKTELDANIDFIYGDVDQLKQVFLNVTLNAFQAVKEDGEVFIKTSQDSQKVYVEISDNGQGIPPEVGEHIFDLYFTTKPDGGGIGLALCKKIVEAHEGRIWFRSSSGQGTTFTISLPRISQTRKERIQTRLTELGGK